MSHATSLPESSVVPEDPPEVAEPSEESDSSLWKLPKYTNDFMSDT